MKLHFEQAQRNQNFRIQSEITERVAGTKGKGQNYFTKLKTGECSVEGKWVLFKRGLLYFLHSHAPGNGETSAERAKNTGVSNLKPASRGEEVKRYRASILFCTDGKRTD